MTGDTRTRYALVGTGARAEMFTRALVTEHADRAQLVALADPNTTRMAAHNDRLVEWGAAPVPTWRITAADDTFRRMLDTEQVDTVIVCTVDRYHADYVVAALQAGRDAITEKPMTTDVTGCRRILDAVAQTGRRVTVTFNYRYNPVHEKVRELLASGVIGEIGSVHFEWLLDVRHGADYFRRWHRDKANSGGLMVHKATHHFDLVNWWIDGTPVEVYARGRLFFYGPEGQRHGYARQYARATAAPDAAGDPFALDLASHPRLRALYLDAEHEDGYHRDQNVFGPGVTIEDDMSVLVTYASGATMTYHLTAYSPWEGYRLMVNGSKGRLELEVVENDYVSPTTAATVKGEAGSAALHGDTAPPEDGSVRLTVHPFWEKPRQIQVPHERTGHGGADARMTAAIFGPSTGPDPLGRSATERDGAASLLVGLAANESFRTGAPVKVADLLAPYTLTDLVPGHSTR